MEYLIAEYDDESFSIVAQLESEHIAYIHVNYGYIAKLFVNKEHRRKGIGSTLLKCAEYTLKKRNYVYCQLDIIPIDTDFNILVEFYMRNGYLLKSENRYIKHLKDV